MTTENTELPIQVQMKNKLKRLSSLQNLPYKNILCYSSTIQIECSKYLDCVEWIFWIKKFSKIEAVEKLEAMEGRPEDEFILFADFGGE